MSTETSLDLTQEEIARFKALPAHVKAKFLADWDAEDAARAQKQLEAEQKRQAEQKAAHAAAVAAAREHVKTAVAALRSLDATGFAAYTRSVL